MKNKKNYSILYAEDDSIIREGYISYFQSIFYTVYEASDGEEALELYNQHLPDIVIFDINMPKLDGLSLIEKIRLTDTKTHILILSACKEEEKLLRAIPLGLVQYLIKPVKKNQLDNVINDVIDKLDIMTNQNNQESVVWDKEQEILYINDKKVHVTKNEIILLNLLSSNSKAQYSLDDILNEFWNLLHEKEMTYHSIRNIIKRLKTKLPRDSIQNHYGVGYRITF